nr:MAG TPA: hypothetical protein [Bacteriophage sp.]
MVLFLVLFLSKVVLFLNTLSLPKCNGNVDIITYFSRLNSTIPYF